MLDGKSEIYEISEDVIAILNMNADNFAEPDGDVYSYLNDASEEPLVEEDGMTEDDLVEDIVPEDTADEEPTTDDILAEDTTTEE